MIKHHAPTTNCFQSFLSCMCDCELSETEPCSTEHDDWQEKTNKFLTKRGLFYLELDPNLCSMLPNGFICGANVGSIDREKRHLIIVESVIHPSGDFQTFIVAHSPSGLWPIGTEIKTRRIVLILPLPK